MSREKLPMHGMETHGRHGPDPVPFPDPFTLTVEDGSTAVSPTSEIIFNAPFVVTDDGGEVARVSLAPLVYAKIAIAPVSPYTNSTPIGLTLLAGNGFTVGATSFSFDEPGLYFARMGLQFQVDGASAAPILLSGAMFASGGGIGDIYQEPHALAGGESLAVTFNPGDLLRIAASGGPLNVGDAFVCQVNETIGAGTLSVLGGRVAIFRVAP